MTLFFTVSSIADPGWCDYDLHQFSRGIQLLPLLTHDSRTMIFMSNTAASSFFLCSHQIVRVITRTLVLFGYAQTFIP